MIKLSADQLQVQYYVSVAAQFLTYASFLSGAKICHVIYKEKSCAHLSPVPFLAGLNSAALWLRYGFISGELELITVNIVGISCALFYLGFFVIYTRQRSRLFKQLLSIVVFLLTLFYTIDHSVNPEFLAGSLAFMSSLVACASPLATIQDVLKTKCVASLPFPMIASSVIVSSTWLLYGFLKNDSFIILSNIITLAISGAQLLLFAIYPSTYPYEKLSPSNKKSYDLLRLLEPEEDIDEQELMFDISEIHTKVINTDQNYKDTLTKMLGRIYSKNEQLSKNQSAIMLLFTVYGILW